jgi:hypothetical protein
MGGPDSVVWGLHRTYLSGKDINRVWQLSDPMMHPIPSAVLDLITVLQRTRPILFFLDFHGNAAACDSFVYDFMKEHNHDLYNVEKMRALEVRILRRDDARADSQETSNPIGV